MHSLIHSIFYFFYYLLIDSAIQLLNLSIIQQTFLVQCVRCWILQKDKSPCWGNTPSCTRRRMGPRDQRRRQTTPELNKEFIKGTYRMTQSLEWQQDSGFPHLKGMGAWYRLPPGTQALVQWYSKAVNNLMGLLIYVRTFPSGDIGLPLHGRTGGPWKQLASQDGVDHVKH